MKSRPSTDPAMAWRRAIQRNALRQLNAGQLDAATTFAERRSALAIRRTFRQPAFRPLEQWRSAGPPTATLTGRFQGDGFRVENLILETYPGWRTGLNLYLPDGDGPFTPVLCPCGHGPKWQDDHQIPPQVLARHGFAAALFDAPGFGEQTRGCDHFIQGAQMAMAGLWSQLCFLADPIRVADYLETRPDIRTADGFGATGVSGGGHTTLSLAHLDPRIRVLVPACCLGSARQTLIEGLYTYCPEVYLPGQLKIGMDMDDLLAMAAPLPCLALAGKQDTFFTPASAREAIEKARPFYADAGAGDDRLDFFFDDTGHRYTEKMAIQAAAWFSRHLRNPQHPAPEPGHISLLEPGQLMCGGKIAEGTGMAGLVRSEAERLRRERRPMKDTRTLCRILRLSPGRRRRATWDLRPDPSPWADPRYLAGAVRGRGTLALPAVEYRRAGGNDTDALLIAFPERDSHERLRELYGLPGIARLAAVDLRGFGQLKPAPATHDIKPWCAMDRVLSDLVLMTGETPVGIQTEDALRAIDAAVREDPDDRTVMLMGYGETALPTLLAGILHPRVRRIILDGGLASLEMLAVAEHPAWSRYLYLPDALRHFDLPELAAAAGGKELLLINPRDAARQRMDAIATQRLYACAPAVSVHVDLSAESCRSAVIHEWLRQPADTTDDGTSPDPLPAIHGGRPVRTRPFPSPKILGADLIGIAELDRVRETLATKTLFRHYGIGHPVQTHTFEQTACRRIGSRYALGVTSGSAALFCAMAGLGIGPGDEVVLSAFSWQAAYNAIMRFGALPVFCDIDRSLNLSPEAFGRCITPRTKAVVVVHFQGGPADLDAIKAMAKPHNIAILEDCAQAIGGTHGGRGLGTIGDVGIYSFQGNKILTAGEGGLLVTSDAGIFERAVRFHDLGLLRESFANRLGREKDQATLPGEQFRMSELTAAVLLAQFDRLDWLLGRCRRHWHAIRESLGARLPDLRFRHSPDPEGDCGISLFFDMGTPEAADAFSKALEAEGIPVGPSSNISNLLNQDYIRNKAGCPAGMPPFQPGGPGEKVTYGPHLAPATDDIVNAMVAIPIAPRYGDRDVADIIAAVIKLHHAGLMPVYT